MQLAKHAGAYVTAVSSSAEQARGLRELGADEVIAMLEPAGGEFDVIVEAVGGATLGAALQRVAAGGIVVSFAASDQQEPTTFPSRALFGRAPARGCTGCCCSLSSPRAHRHARPRPARFAVAAGKLDCSIDHEARR